MTDPTPDPVGLLVDGGVAHVTWHRPGRRNAIGLEICRLLTDVLVDLADRTDVGVVVLDAATGPFCAGFDLNDMAELDSGAMSPEEFFAVGRSLMAALDTLPQTIVAGPREFAYGFGCGLLAHCDLVIAADTAVFGIPEIHKGVVPSTVVPDLLRVMTGRSVISWAVTGARFTAAEALAAGLATSVVAADDHHQAVADAVRALAGNIGLLNTTKAVVKELSSMPPEHRVTTALRLAADHLRVRAEVGPR